MKRECNIVRDLLPLYIENMASPESAQFVEAHLSKCPECNEFYFSMTDRGEEEIDDEEVKKKIIPLKIVKQKLLCKRIVTSVIAVVLALALLIGGGTLAYNIVDKENKKAEIDYGESQWCSLEDRKTAVDRILKDFIYPFGFGYDVISIRFAGDDECYRVYMDEEDLPITDILNGVIWNDTDVWWKETDYMVFNVAMKTPAWADRHKLMPDTFYGNIRCVFKRMEDRSGWQFIYIDMGIE